MDRVARRDGRAKRADARTDHGRRGRLQRVLHVFLPHVFSLCPSVVRTPANPGIAPGLDAVLTSWPVDRATEPTSP
jgi:hypothetical protein